MSLQTCQTGSITGFPVTLSQQLYTDWPATDKAQDKLRTLVAPTDFTVQWGPVAQSAQISVVQNELVFQITGISTATSMTTLVYGSAVYSCSEVLSIVKNQHSTMCNDSDALYELILAYQIRNKAQNPSAPDIILMCRPIVFTKNQTTPFWETVNTAVKTGVAQTISFDLSSLFAYNADILMPMITYNTCLPVKLLNYQWNAESTLGSINMRVHVVTQPMYIKADDSGTGLCSSIQKYTLITQPRRLVDLFDGAAASTVFQFMDGLGSDRFPSTNKDNFYPLIANSSISAFQDVIHTFEILVPEAFLGKSLGEIADSETPAPVKPPKKQYKCFRINPDTDIKGDQILIDPTTGESLLDTMEQAALDNVGGDPSLLDMPSADASGLMPGDVQHILSIVLITLGTITLLAYLMFIVHTVMFRKDFHKGLFHAVIFLILLGGLIAFGIFFGGPDTEVGYSWSSIPAGADPRCYVNGSLVGTRKSITMPPRGPNSITSLNIMNYTEYECNKLGGTFNIQPDLKNGDIGICYLKIPDPNVVGRGGHLYNFFCSTDPNTIAMMKQM